MSKANLRSNKKQERSVVMFRIYKKLSALALLVPFLLVSAAAESAQPVGKVTIESKAISIGVGVTWGDGTLEFEGKEYKFSMSGLTLVDVGIRNANAVGDVYNLTDPSLFSGTYVAVEVSFALVGGVGGIALRNQNGVVIHLRSVQQGVNLQLGPSGLALNLE